MALKKSMSLDELRDRNDKSQAAANAARRQGGTPAEPTPKKP